MLFAIADDQTAGALRDGHDQAVAAALDWLEREHLLDPPAARNVRSFVRRQVERTGVVPSDRLLVIEASRDPLGDWQVVVLSPWGSRRTPYYKTCGKKKE